MSTNSVGFAFSADRKFVALIEKQRPKWQAGKLNGIGGHVEEGEPLAVAQQREFWEETSIVIPANSWRAFASLIGADWHFVAFTDEIFNIRGEEIADKRGMAKIIHRAKWRANGVYNPRAGFERNGLIVRDADRVVAFWDGRSNGTRDTIHKAEAAGKTYEIILPAPLHTLYSCPARA